MGSPARHRAAIAVALAALALAGCGVGTSSAGGVPERLGCGGRVDRAAHILGAHLEAVPAGLQVLIALRRRAGGEGLAVELALEAECAAPTAAAEDELRFLRGGVDL